MTRNRWLVGAKVRVIGGPGNHDTDRTGTIVAVEHDIKRVGKTKTHAVTVHLSDGRIVSFLSTQLVLA